MKIIILFSFFFFLFSAVNVEGRGRFNYQTINFKINPDKIDDTLAFISKLEANCHVKLYGSKSLRKINILDKSHIFGLQKMIYLIELGYDEGAMVDFPWKHQIILDEKGKLLGILSGINCRFVTILYKSSPFLVLVKATAKGNGQHEVYMIKNNKLVNVLNFPSDFCVRTYDAHGDQTVNIPNELSLNIEDNNHDGFNDIVFTGYIELIMGVSKDNQWFNMSKNTNGQLVTYSITNPFKKIPVKYVFIYNLTSKTFIPQKKYNEFCLDNLYRFIYN